MILVIKKFLRCGHLYYGSYTASDAYALPFSDKILVEIDERNCPCNKAAYLLGSFFSSIAKDGSFAPIHIARWDNRAFIQKKQAMLDFIELKFDYNEKARTWVLEKLNGAWRNYKTNLKAKYFDGKPFEEAFNNPPNEPMLLPDQWGPLVMLWNTSDKMQKECKTNTLNAKKQIHHHTGGRKSIARKKKRDDG